MMIPYGKWQPDLGPANAGVTVALNCLYAEDGYEVMYSPTVVHQSIADGTPLLMMNGRTSTGIVIPILFTSIRSYRMSSTGWKVINSSEYPSGSWEAVQWGDAIYATNGMNNLQKLDLFSNADFIQINTPNNMSGRFIAIVGDFLVMADIRENMSSTRYPFRTQWSGILRPERWTPDPAIQSDYQDVSDIGELRGLAGGEYGLILGAKGLTRMDYIGGDAIFKFSTLEDDIGCEISESVIRVGAMTFWWSKKGWRLSTGGPSIPIGYGHVDRWFNSVVDRDKVNRMSVQAAFNKPYIIWSFVSKYSMSGEPDYMLMYNYNAKAWSYSIQTVGRLGVSAVESVSTDDANLPLPGFVYGESTTDDYQEATDGWATNEGSFMAAVMNVPHCQLAQMDQAGDLKAEIEHAEQMINVNGVAMINRVLPMVHEASYIELDVFLRKNMAMSTYEIRRNLVPGPSGRISVRKKGRYFRSRIKLSGAFRRAQGMMIPDDNIVLAGGR